MLKKKMIFVSWLLIGRFAKFKSLNSLESNFKQFCRSKLLCKIPFYCSKLPKKAKFAKIWQFLKNFCSMCADGGFFWDHLISPHTISDENPQSFSLEGTFGFILSPSKLWLHIFKRIQDEILSSRRCRLD